MDPFVAIMFFFVLPGFFAFAALMIYQYLQNLFALVGHLERNQPELWKQLGSPKSGSMVAPGPNFPRGTQYTISPFGPLFMWLLTGSFQNLDAVTLGSARRTRAFFWNSLIAFILLIACFLIFVTFAESA